MFRARNIDYDVSDRVDGLSCGGIGVIQQMVQRLGLAEAIDEKLQLPKLYQPYHESDHVLNIAYNPLAGGKSLEDLEILRNNEVRLKVWQNQPESFFEEAIIDVTGRWSRPTGNAKKGSVWPTTEHGAITRWW